MADEPMCKGAWSLGTACGKCSKCLESAPAEISSLRLDLELYVNSWRRNLGEFIAPKRHLVDALALGTARVVAEVRQARALSAAIAKWRADAVVAQTLGIAEPSLLEYLPAAVDTKEVNYG